MSAMSEPGATAITVIVPCYRDAARAVACATHLLEQAESVGGIELVVVDDGSGEPESAYLQQQLPRGARLLSLEENRGRSGARNAGASAASGAWLMFVDSDCVPEEGLLAAYASLAKANLVGAVGDVRGTGDGEFWDRYQAAASERRRRLHRAGQHFMGSSPNLAVERQTFLSVGGFDEAYRHYGFEDRDLLVRLAAKGRIEWVPDAVVRHMDRLSMTLVSRKMVEAGRHSARFASIHPQVYRDLGYAALDTRAHAWLRPLTTLMAPLLEPAARMCDRMVRIDAVPYPLKHVMVRVLTAFSYAVGTDAARLSEREASV